MDLPSNLSIDELGRRFREGSLSPVSAARQHLKSIERHNASLRCLFSVSEDVSLAEAAAALAKLSSGIDLGPLHGIPYVVADVIDVAGLTTSCGSRLMRDHVARRTADVVSNLREAGAVYLGKAAIFEFGLGIPEEDSEYRAARNPYDVRRTAGATGAAAAVAAGFAKFAIAPDTGGAARASAALCGVVGIKPTFGSISPAGILPVAPSLDHCGIVASSVEEVATILQTIAPTAMPEAAASKSASRIDHADSLDVGIVHGLPGIHQGVLRAIDDLATTLRATGNRVKTLNIDYYDRLVAAGQIIYAFECLQQHREALANNPGLIGRHTRNRMVVGAFLSDADYRQAREVASELSERFDDLIAGVDVVLSPTTSGPAPAADQSSYGVPGRSGLLTLPFNVTGHPTISFPIGRVDGLPIGLQATGKRHGDANLLAVAQTLNRLIALSNRPEKQ